MGRLAARAAHLRELQGSQDAPLPECSSLQLLPEAEPDSPLRTTSANFAAEGAEPAVSALPAVNTKISLQQACGRFQAVAELLEEFAERTAKTPNEAIGSIHSHSDLHHLNELPHR